MKVFIIEDEIPAAEKIQRYLKRYDENIEILGQAMSVKQAISWLDENHDVDLLLMDIQLTDGLSFDIFKSVKIDIPVIFTTAYNEYAIEAFKANGIDYLLKPVTFDALSESLDKFKNLKNRLSEQGKVETESVIDLQAALQMLSKREYKTRFMVKIGEHIRSVTTDTIHLFYAEGRNAYIVTEEGKRLIIDYKLETLEEMLDPKKFFRVNRSYIIEINAIKDVLVYSNSRLKIILHLNFDREIIVSREKVNAFKTWFDGE
ncbi:LytTR family DNA-binding domain-containing protein [uncultured Roseivirga sp.]|uniref:LytR/AlgR family response regulator transcription factor n=1 Tax=uncultured Roseivirga sp. TaxID=543088 RepID=UPI0030DBEC81